MKRIRKIRKRKNATQLPLVWRDYVYQGSRIVEQGASRWKVHTPDGGVSPTLTAQRSAERWARIYAKKNPMKVRNSIFGKKKGGGPNVAASRVVNPKRHRKVAKRKRRNGVVPVAGGFRSFQRGRISPIFPTRRDALLWEAQRNPKRLTKKKRVTSKPTKKTNPIAKRGRRRNAPKPVVKDYLLTTPQGKAIRRATKVIFPGGLEVRFTERMPKEKAIAQASQQLKKNNPVLKLRKRNYANAEELYTKFHGRGPDRVDTIEVAETDAYAEHPELAQLGKLISLYVGEGVKLEGKEGTVPKQIEKDGWIKVIQFDQGHQPDVAAEPGGKQLYLVGGNQNLDSQLADLGADPDKNLVDLGFCYRIEYFTKKKFDSFQPVYYWHLLGEETGVSPRLMYDRSRKLIQFAGGEYEIRPEGIVN
jgi:hypothetical protein